MSQTARIRRGSAASRPRSVGARPKAAAKRVQGRADSLLDSLPISPGLRRGIGRWGAIAVVAALLVVLASAFKVPAAVGTALGEAAGAAGFSLKHVEPRGLKRMDPLAVYSATLDQDSMAMPLINLDQVRARLLTNGWVRDARVSRRLPDTIVVDIVERVPAAIWQNRQRLMLIDADGIVLEPVRLDALPDLPLVIGPAANMQASALNRLLDGVPAMKSMMAGATWIGGRRWDVRFQSGEVLALPEGEAAAGRALRKFARLDATAGMLGKGLVRFDMRIPGKMYIRMSSEPGKRVQLGADGGGAI